MKILVACEFSGIVREAFKRKGHDAWSCDILDTEIPGQHIKDDVLKHLNDGWDMMIAHPPCTYLSNAGVQYALSRLDKIKDARIFFITLFNAPIEKICLENPMPHRYADLPKHSTKVTPRYFGGYGDKNTYLWLKNLPPLMATYIYPMGKRWKTPNGKQNSEWYLKSNSKERSRTSVYLAEAMANQWG